jgi:hypothetical protein
MITENDQKKKRCPMLGHEIAFRYCRKPGTDAPCRKIFDCWWETFDIQEFMKEHYSDDTIRKTTAPPANKISALYDLIQKAKERTHKKT